MVAVSARDEMVRVQLAERGIDDPRVRRAFAAVPRENFLPDHLRASAYDDRALPIAEGQTISQPYVVALMAQALGLTGAERVLEVGTGCGYAAAILSHLVKEVYTIERHPALADQAVQRLTALGINNVTVTCGDGTFGWPEHAPYDAIAVAASAAEVPLALRQQLVLGGRLVMPLGGRDEQQLVRLIRSGDEKFVDVSLARVRFVPLIGQHG